MKINFLWLFSILIFVGFINCDTCAWETCPEWSSDPNFYNIHFVPHTHDDMGWIKTADDYYTGNLPLVNKHGVQYIISTVVQELTKNTTRKFSYAETGFLTRWLEDKDDYQINHLINLVKTGQIELIGGGWVQPDEAATHYIELIDMYTVGLRKLQSVFGNECGKPRTGWQIDPFGHSKEHANLLSLMGYESVYFAREDMREHQKRKAEKRLEFNWYTSNENPSRNILGAVFIDHYQQPRFLDFDISNAESVPVIDNENLEDYNVDKFAKQLAEDVLARTNTQPHNHYIYMMGSDFHYSDANHYYSNMDRLINYVNKNNYFNMTIQYSTPVCYTTAIKNSNTIKTNKTYDFFPYADALHNYWTGYFTSKPALKGLVRRTSNMLNTFRQMITFSKNPNIEEFTSPEDKLERALGLSLHHDGITGTSKEYVTQNYIKRIFEGYGPIQQLLQTSLNSLNNDSSYPIQHHCLLMNESICDFTNSNNQNFAVTIYNGNNQQMTELIRIPIYFNVDDILDPSGQPVYFKWLSSPFYIYNQFNDSNTANDVAYFMATVPPNGYSTYFLTSNKAETKIQRNNFNKIIKNQPKTNQIYNGVLKVEFDNNNKIAAVTNMKLNKTYALKQDFYYYKGHNSLNNERASGAYIFRPQNDSEPTIVSETPSLSLDSMGIEARQRFSDYVTQTIRLIPEKDFIEFEWTIGPIPITKDGLILYGQEVVTRYTASGIANNEIFYTDANGRQIMKRQLFHNPDFDFGGDEMVAGNFYPVNTKAFIKDDKNMMVVLTDRSQGVSAVNIPHGSVVDGSLQFMLHRRDMYDDGKGVNEALNEPGKDGRGLVVRGVHRVYVGDTDELTSVHRQASVEFYHQPVISLSTVDSVNNFISKYQTTFTGLNMNMPKNIHIVTVKQLSPGKVLLRLEHIYAENEDTGLSKPVTIDISKIFKYLTVQHIQELSLGSNDVLNDLTDTVVTLNPQDLKTYLLNVV